MAKANSTRLYVIHDGIITWFNGPRFDELAKEEYDKSATQLEAMMKSRAPWADRTGQARSSLTARAEGNNGQVSITLSHGVDHGRWLELIQNGRFAIIKPILEEEARRVTYNAIRRIRYAKGGS